MSETAETTNTATIIKGVKITKTVSLKADESTPDDEKKKINLVIDFEGVSIAQIIEAAVRSDVIKWQGANRDNFDKLVTGSTVNRKFAAPPVTVVTDEMAEAAMISKLVAFETDEERETYLAEVLAKLKK